jgi:hypothetical protein
MAENFFLQLFYSALDFLWGSFVVSLVVFLFALLALIVRRKIAKRFNLSWVKSTVIVLFVLLFCTVFSVYFFPWSQTLNVPRQSVPQEFEDSLQSQVGFLFVVLLRLLIVSFVLTLLVFPSVLVGSFLLEWFSTKTRLPFVARFFAATFISTALVSYVLLFLAPFILPGVLFMIFFGFG